MKRETFLEARQKIELELGEALDLSATPWRWIPLSPVDPSLRCLVDAVDHAWLSQFVWNVWHAGCGRADEWIKYAKRNTGPGRATVRMHREIMIAAEPQAEAFLRSHVVDHINRQTLDNRRANLRWSSQRGNVFNRGARGSAPTLEAIVAELVAGLEPSPLPEEIPF